MPGVHASASVTSESLNGEIACRFAADLPLDVLVDLLLCDGRRSAGDDGKDRERE
jgi:hypothetical protein